MKNFPFLRQKKDKDKDKKKSSSLTKGRQPAAPAPAAAPVAAKKEQATPPPVKMVRPSTNLPTVIGVSVPHNDRRSFDRESYPMLYNAFDNPILTSIRFVVE